MSEPTLAAQASPPITAPYRLFVCVVCGFIYDEAKGLPEDGFPPGTRFEDIPNSWMCPDCGVGKEDFELA
ncbi:MAG: rubredoxin [Lysobacterales bacterium CG02_land_8_20_14_3_00_62_12]|nr:MAG: rubredoxin [Xanthomonadales bacterium CG02_land_8_20_14_3_00_62_12]PJA37677.1 MAG: rubredoxin [Xanthomonadales bacterium CG_4_9_14_3_um_filter_62_6]